MATHLHSQPPWMSTLKTSTPFKSVRNLPNPPSFRILIRLSSSSNPSTADDSPSPDSKQIGDDSKNDRVNLAFNKALEYKKSLRSSGGGKTVEPSKNELGAGGIRDNKIVKLEFDSVSKSDSSVEKSKEVRAKKGDGGGKDELPEAMRIAMEKAKEYKKNKGAIVEKSPGDENGNLDASNESLVQANEYEMLKERLISGQSNQRNKKLPGPNSGSKKELKVSKMDFVGLDFSDNKQRRGLPPGLVPTPDPYLWKDLPEIEMIVGDASKFGNTPTDLEATQENDVLDLYKPKVSTWGVFPRPNNISEAYGGGRTLRPGEKLEPEEVKAAKEARTKQLLAEYKARTGLNVNPKLKEECGKALKDGDELMDMGKLKDALPYYQEVMDKMPFQTELHGLAALQWAICQDSLNRSNEAQSMYKKLKSHPNALVNKKASQLAFSFEAMELLKVRSSAPINPGYDTYFDAFVKDKAKVIKQDIEPEDSPPLTVTENLPYIIFLILPLLLVLLIAAKKGI